MLKEIDLTSQADAHVRAALADGVFLVRHNLSEALLDDAYGLLGEFFALPLDRKLACRAPGTNGQAGYTPALVETPERSRVPDWKELFHWGRRLPAGHPLRQRYPSRYPDPVMPDEAVPRIGAVLEKLHASMFEFQLRVTSVIAAAFGLHPDYFTEMLTDGPVVNRAAWYPPITQAPTSEHTWAVEHQDFDLITALPRATASGLEVLVGGCWQRVSPPPGYAVINAGMALERLTSGAVPAVMHKVIPSPGASAGRLSIVQFCHPTPWTVLTPLDLPGPASGRFPTLMAGDLFDRTMYRINRIDAARDASVTAAN